MELVAARASDYADDAARVAAIFGVVVAGEDPELFDRFRIWIEHQAVVQKIGVETAIQQERHRIGSLSGDTKARAAGDQIG